MDKVQKPSNHHNPLESTNMAPITHKGIWFETHITTEWTWLQILEWSQCIREDATWCPLNTGSSSRLTFVLLFSLICNPHLSPSPQSETSRLLGYWHPLIWSQPHSSLCYIIVSPFSCIFASGVTMFLWNNGTCLQNYMEPHPWRQRSWGRSNCMYSEDMITDNLVDTLLMSSFSRENLLHWRCGQ
jgi:hypothetical protein